MAMENDRTLAARPEQFELVESPRTARFFRMVGLFEAVLMVVVAIIVYATVDEPLIPVLVILVFAVSGPLVFLWLSHKTREWRLTDGRPLKSWSSGLSSDREETWERLATGDPARYTPLKLNSSEHTMQYLKAFWPEDERVTYVVITDRNTEHGETSEIIELWNDKHDAFQTAKERGLNKKPA